MSRLSLSIALVLCLGGCETAPRDGSTRVSPELAARRAEQRQGGSEWLSEIDARLNRALPLPSADAPLRCPDEKLELSASARNTLLLRVRDARVERRSILPLELLRTLAPDELSAFRDEALALLAPAPNPSGAADARGAPKLDLLKGLMERRFLGEIVVEAFAAPHNFRRLNALHSEWSAGRLDARLVVYDLEERALLCSAELHARGDASGAPLARRLRESTRKDLEQKLYGRAVRELSLALSRISHVLRLPVDESLSLSLNDAP
jgi:hypothetical protein